MFATLEGANDEKLDAIDQALNPPNKVNPATGMPYGWTEEDELDGLDTLLTL
jgi:hypothetical protein